MKLLIRLKKSVPVFFARTARRYHITLFRQLMVNLMADTGLLGLDIRNDQHDAANSNLLYIYQPVLPNSLGTYLKQDSTSRNLRLLYKTYLTQVSNTGKNVISTAFAPN